MSLDAGLAGTRYASNCASSMRREAAGSPAQSNCSISRNPDAERASGALGDGGQPPAEAYSSVATHHKYPRSPDPRRRQSRRIGAGCRSPDTTTRTEENGGQDDPAIRRVVAAGLGCAASGVCAPCLPYWTIRRPRGMISGKSEACSWATRSFRSVDDPGGWCGSKLRRDVGVTLRAFTRRQLVCFFRSGQSFLRRL